MMTLKDQSGTVHSFYETPKRIISLVPSITETLYELGLENEIVGITNACTSPYHFKATKLILGQPNDVNLDKIEALQPEIVMASTTYTPSETIRQLSEKHKVYIENNRSFEDVIDMLHVFGTLFNKRTDAQKWIEKLQFAHKDFLYFMASKPERKAAFLVSREPYKVAGSDVFVNETFAWNKFTNIYIEREKGFPEVEIRKMRIQGDPDVVFLSSEFYDFKEEHAFEIGRSTHHAKTVFVDGAMFSWSGTRLFRAYEYFRILHERLGDE